MQTTLSFQAKKAECYPEGNGSPGRVLSRRETCRNLPFRKITKISVWRIKGKRQEVRRAVRRCCSDLCRKKWSEPEPAMAVDRTGQICKRLT